MPCDVAEHQLSLMQLRNAAQVSELFDVMNQAEELPLPVDLVTAA